MDTHVLGLLVACPLDFKVRVGNLTHSLRLTSGVRPTDLLVASIAARQITSIYLQAYIGGTCHLSDECSTN